MLHGFHLLLTLVVLRTQRMKKVWHTQEGGAKFCQLNEVDGAKSERDKIQRQG